MALQTFPLISSRRELFLDMLRNVTRVFHVWAFFVFKQRDPAPCRDHNEGLGLLWKKAFPLLHLTFMSHFNFLMHKLILKEEFVLQVKSNSLNHDAVQCFCINL